jgi:hypothetical protein
MAVIPPGWALVRVTRKQNAPPGNRCFQAGQRWSQIQPRAKAEFRLIFWLQNAIANLHPPAAFA